MEPQVLIPVWCIIDADAVLNKFPQGGTKAAPQYLGEYDASDAYVIMVAPLPYVLSGSGTSELALQAPKGAQIQMMTNTFAKPSANVVKLVAITNNHPDQEKDVCTPFVKDNIRSSADKSGLISAMSAQIRDDVNAGDRTGYLIVFNITPKNSEKALYYSWDPSIQVSDATA
jgi:Inclusion body protein